MLWFSNTILDGMRIWFYITCFTSTNIYAMWESFFPSAFFAVGVIILIKTMSLLHVSDTPSKETSHDTARDCLWKTALSMDYFVFEIKWLEFGNFS